LKKGYQKRRLKDHATFQTLARFIYVVFLLSLTNFSLSNPQMISALQLKQAVLLLLIAGAFILVGRQLYPFIPGLLGAVTLYILLRNPFFRLTVIHNWKPWLAATLFIIGCLIVFVLPFLLTVMLIAPKVSLVMHNPDIITNTVGKITASLQQYVPQLHFDQTQFDALLRRITNNFPSFLGGTLQILTNLLLCFFLLYFMLISGRKMERRMQEFVALKDENIDDIWVSTRTMVVSNAIGIPLLALIQALAATIGFMIFGVDGALLWGILTGIFSMLPVIGTAVVCVPIVAYMYASGKGPAATGLLLYSLIVIGNIDNVMRFTLLRKLGDVHPVITVLGVMVGVPLFGFMGLIFGPLLVSYMLLLIRIYRVEFPARPKSRGEGS
jgi:predicted PurR-regulated permease PerM